MWRWFVKVFRSCRDKKYVRVEEDEIDEEMI